MRRSVVPPAAAPGGAATTQASRATLSPRRHGAAAPAAAGGAGAGAAGAAAGRRSPRAAAHSPRVQLAEIMQAELEARAVRREVQRAEAQADALQQQLEDARVAILGYEVDLEREGQRLRGLEVDVVQLGDNIVPLAANEDAVANASARLRAEVAAAVASEPQLAAAVEQQSPRKFPPTAGWIPLLAGRRPRLMLVTLRHSRITSLPRGAARPAPPPHTLQFRHQHMPQLHHVMHAQPQLTLLLLKSTRKPHATHLRPQLMPLKLKLIPSSQHLTLLLHTWPKPPSATPEPPRTRPNHTPRGLNALPPRTPYPLPTHQPPNVRSAMPLPSVKHMPRPSQLQHMLRPHTLHQDAKLLHAQLPILDAWPQLVGASPIGPSDKRRQLTAYS